MLVESSVKVLLLLSAVIVDIQRGCFIIFKNDFLDMGDCRDCPATRVFILPDIWLPPKLASFTV